jgi:hypothetical protein
VGHQDGILHHALARIQDDLSKKLLKFNLEGRFANFIKWLGQVA